MDVDVDLPVRDLEKEIRFGREVLLQDPPVGLLEGGADRLVLDRPLIDEEELVTAVGPAERRSGGESPNAARALGVIDLHQPFERVFPEELEDPLAEASDRGAVQEFAPTMRRREPQAGVGERDIGQIRGDRRQLGRVALQEFQPGREVEEEVADLDGRSARRGDFADRKDALPPRIRRSFPARRRLRKSGASGGRRPRCWAAPRPGSRASRSRGDRLRSRSCSSNGG